MLTPRNAPASGRAPALAAGTPGRVAESVPGSTTASFCRLACEPSIHGSRIISRTGAILARPKTGAEGDVLCAELPIAQ